MLARIVPPLAACLLAAGCAAYSGAGLRPGVSTEAEVRSTMGRPAAEFANADGSKRLAYPRGPLGTQTFMADVGSDGLVRAVMPVLNDETFRQIRPGDTRDDVLRLIGPPGDRMAYPLSGNYSWDYRFVDSWGYVSIFSVTFDASGRVVSKIAQRVDRGERKGP